MYGMGTVTDSWWIGTRQAVVVYELLRELSTSPSHGLCIRHITGSLCGLQVW
jgi:hypothetical protein